MVACKDKNDLPLGEKYRRVYDYAGGSWQQEENGAWTHKDSFSYAVSIACNHCIAPACMAVCPVDAIIKRDDGIVFIDNSACIGCGACVTACPYGEPYISTVTGVAQKCDFCRSLIDKGENPACVDACPMRCLLFGELSDLQATYGEVDQVAPLPESTNTGPSTVYNRSRLNPDGKLSGSVVNEPEELESVTV
jgi:anaerobic dimethyl sulfoxide reductase subunit B (iron-sulfur subunit)